LIHRLINPPKYFSLLNAQLNRAHYGHTHTHVRAFNGLFWDYPGESVPEEEIILWTLWCNGG